MYAMSMCSKKLLNIFSQEHLVTHDMHQNFLKETLSYFLLEQKEKMGNKEQECSPPAASTLPSFSFRRETLSLKW